MKDVIEIYKDKKGEYRWRRIAKNGKILADSGESYKRKAMCYRMAQQCCTEPNAVVDVCKMAKKKRAKKKK